MTSNFHCGGVGLLCGTDGVVALSATTRHAYHRAEYEYDLLDIPEEVQPGSVDEGGEAPLALGTTTFAVGEKINLGPGTSKNFRSYFQHGDSKATTSAVATDENVTLEYDTKNIRDFTTDKIQASRTGQTFSGKGNFISSYHIPASLKGGLDGGAGQDLALHGNLDFALKIVVKCKTEVTAELKLEKFQ